MMFPLVFVGVAYLTVLWVALAYWMVRDARLRSTSPSLAMVAAGLGLVLPFLGVLVYLVIRPPRTLDEERALAVYALPERARRRALALSVAAVALTTGLIASVLPLVDGGGLVERSVGTLVAGVPLAVRGDSTGVVIALAACAATLVTLLEPPRRSLERTALLLCLAGTCIVCLSANAVLVYCGLELGNVGFLLLTVAGTSDQLTRRRAKLAFAVFHVAALRLLPS